jgi:hypothetical protein
MTTRPARLTYFFVQVGLSTLAIAADDPLASTPALPAKAPYDASLYSGGDGLSKKHAVVIESPSETRGIASEYVWVAHRYPGSKVLRQALTTWQHGKRFDVLTVATGDGSQVELWFDITKMYKD